VVVVVVGFKMRMLPSLSRALATLVVLALGGSARAAYCSGSPAPGDRTNDYPILDAQPQLLRTAENGQVFEVSRIVDG
jgi:hypothetical protein